MIARLADVLDPARFDDDGEPYRWPGEYGLMWQTLVLAREGISIAEQAQMHPHDLEMLFDLRAAEGVLYERLRERAKGAHGH